MRKTTVLTSCAQAVYELVAGNNIGVSLYSVAASSQTLPVGKMATYTGFKPTFVLGLVHPFLLFLVSVSDGLIHLIHRTNKDYDKLKVIINS